MSRQMVVVPDAKKKIENIKKKYKNMQMSDSDASKIMKLEVTNRILKGVTIGVGIVTVIDYFIPDPVLGLDEAALTAITGLAGYGASVVNNKIEAIAKGDNPTLEMEEISKLSGQLKDVASKVSHKGSSK